MKHYDIDVHLAQDNQAIRQAELNRIKQEIIAQGMYGATTNIIKKYSIEERRERARQAQAEYRHRNKEILYAKKRARIERKRRANEV